MRYLIIALLLLPSAAWAQLCPTGTTPGAVGCQTAAVAPIGTDVLLGWQIEQSAPHTRVMSLSQIAGFVGSQYAAGAISGGVNLGAFPLTLGASSTAPGAPASGGSLYVDGSNVLHFKNAGGDTPFNFGGSNMAGFWTNLTPAGVPQRMLDRLFVGNATLNSGRSDVQSADSTILNGTGASYYDFGATFASYSNIGGIGGAFASTTARIPNGIPTTPIGVASYGGCDSTTSATSCWSYYGQSNRSSGSTAAATLGFEQEVANLGSLVQNNPYNMAPTGVSADLWLGAGGNFAGTPNDTSDALGIITNGSKFVRGIVFQDGALDTTLSGHGIAIEMAMNQELKWGYDSSDGAAAIIRSDATASGTGIVFTNAATNIEDTSNDAEYIFNTPSQPACGWKFLPGSLSQLTANGVFGSPAACDLYLASWLSGNVTLASGHGTLAQFLDPGVTSVGWLTVTPTTGATGSVAIASKTAAGTDNTGLQILPQAAGTLALGRSTTPITVNGTMTLNQPLSMLPISAPGAPASGGSLYVDGSNVLHFKNATTDSSVALLSGAGTLAASGIGLNSGGTLNTAYDATAPTNAVMTTGGGNLISYCPTLSCLTTPSPDHQRTSALFWSTTAVDGQAEEQTLGVETIINTGYAKKWTVGTGYSLGDNVSVNGQVYRATTAGTSAASGGGPSGTGTTITDGSVVWAWINSAAINGKVGLYNEAVVNSGGGGSWAQANNFQLQPGATPSFNLNTEMDFTNNSGTDCAIGVANCIGLNVAVKGTNQSTAGLYVSSVNAGPKYATIWGIRTAGSYLASQADIEVDSNAAVGLSFGGSGIGGSTHATAAIQDTTTSPTTLLVTGTKTTAIDTTGATLTHALNVATGQDVCLAGGNYCLSNSAQSIVAKIGGNVELSVNSAGLTVTPMLNVWSAPSGTQWQTQGGYLGWNFAGAAGETDFINSKGGGAGGFNFYNVASSAGASPTLLGGLDSFGILSAVGGMVAPKLSMLPISAPSAPASGGTMYSDTGNVVRVLPATGGSFDAPVRATGGTTPQMTSARAQDILSPEDFGAKGDCVTDDSAAFNAQAAYVRASTGYQSLRTIRLSPNKCYFVTSSINWGELVPYRVTVEGNGSVIVGAVGATHAIINAVDSILTVKDLHVIAQGSVLYGLQTGNNGAAGSDQPLQLYNVSLLGTFANAALINRGGEDSVYFGLSAINQTATGYAYIADGQAHWAFDNTYQTDTLTPDTQISNNSIACYSCVLENLNSSGANVGVIWLGNFMDHQFINSYALTQGTGPIAVIYSSFPPTSTTNSGLLWDMHNETAPTKEFLFTGPYATQALPHLTYSDHLDQAASGTSIFNLDTGVTSFSLPGLRLSIVKENNASVTVFDQPSKYSGSVDATLPLSNPSWNAAAGSFTGCVTTGTTRACTINTLTVGAFLQLPSYTVATVPTCNAAAKGGMIFVTDATSPTYNGTLTGGGAVGIPASCNGTAWTAH